MLKSLCPLSLFHSLLQFLFISIDYLVSSCFFQEKCVFQIHFCVFHFPFCFSLLFSFFTIHVDEKSGKGKNKFEIENISRNLWNLWGNFAIFHFCVLKVIDNLCFVLTIHKNTVFCLFFPFRSNKKERSTNNIRTI